MTGLRLHYTHHAAAEMRKARITRQTVRRVIQEGRRELERYPTSGEQGWLSTLRIENRSYAVVWVKRKAHLVVVTAYRVGEYD